MATPDVKIIDPNMVAPYDYADLATWQAWAIDDPLGLGHLGYHAACRSGDVGALDIEDWNLETNPPTATDHPKIYALPGHEHGGDTTAGVVLSDTAYPSLTAWSTSYIVVEGLRLTPGVGNTSSVLQMGLAAGQIGRRLLIHNAAANTAIMPLLASGDSLTLENCANHMTGVGSAGWILISANAAAITLRNCSAAHAGSLGFSVGAISGLASGAITLENCVATDSGYADFYDQTPPVNAIMRNCTSSDATADDSTNSTGAQINQDAADLYVDAAGGDYTPDRAGNLYDTGYANSLTTDLADKPRVVHDAIDRGPIEAPGLDLVWLGDDEGNVGDWATAANWTPEWVPNNGDRCFLTRRSSESISSSLDQSTITLARLTVRPGNFSQIGSRLAYLEIGAELLRYAGASRAYIDLGSTTTLAIVENTGPRDREGYALYLAGSALDHLVANGGRTSLGTRPGQSANATSVTIKGHATVGHGNAGTAGQVLALEQCGGRFRTLGVVSLADVHGGRFTTDGGGGVTALTITAGRATLNGAGTIGSVSASGGFVDFTKSGKPRTVTAITARPPARIALDPDIVTITTLTLPNFPFALTIEPKD